MLAALMLNASRRRRAISGPGQICGPSISQLRILVVDVIACPEEGEARVKGSEGRLYLHSMSVPSFPDDATKRLDGADIKTCPNLATQIPHSILLTFILCLPSAPSNLSAGPSLSSAPPRRIVAPTPHVWRNGKKKNL